MRVVGKHRVGKVEGPRLAGFGLMFVGAMALVLSVAAAAGAGSTQAATPAHYQCTKVYAQDGPMAQVLQSVANKDCSHPNTSTTQKHCYCTTTTAAPTSTTQLMGSTVASSTTESTTSSSSTSSSTSTTATTVPTPTDDIVPGNNDEVTTTTKKKSITVEGNTVGTVGQQAETVQPAAETLPLTGSNTTPLALIGLVMVATGFGLTRRTRRLT